MESTQYLPKVGMILLAFICRIVKKKSLKTLKQIIQYYTSSKIDFNEVLI